MTQLVAKLCASAVNADAPEFVHLMPLGQIKGRDGRAWTLSSGQRLVDAFNARGIDLPIDFEHQSEMHQEARVGPVRAAGWIKELQVRADGIWGRVEWTATARELIMSKAYRYLSPAIVHHKGDTEIVRLKRAGLVHHPNLTLTALASEDYPVDTNEPGKSQAPMPLMQRLRKMLQLPDTATEDQIAEAVEAALEALPDPEKYVPIEAMQSVMDDRFERASSQAQARAHTKVKDAMSKGYITPAIKDWATALCTQNEESFEAFLAKSPAAFGHLVETSHLKGLPPSQTASLAVERKDGAASVCRQLGLDVSSLD